MYIRRESSRNDNKFAPNGTVFSTSRRRKACCCHPPSIHAPITAYGGRLIYTAKTHGVLCVLLLAAAFVGRRRRWQWRRHHSTVLNLRVYRQGRHWWTVSVKFRTTSASPATWGCRVDLSRASSIPPGLTAYSSTLVSKEANA